MLLLRPTSIQLIRRPIWSRLCRGLLFRPTRIQLLRRLIRRRQDRMLSHPTPVRLLIWLPESVIRASRPASAFYALDYRNICSERNDCSQLQARVQPVFRWSKVNLPHLSGEDMYIRRELFIFVAPFNFNVLIVRDIYWSYNCII